MARSNTRQRRGNITYSKVNKVHGNLKPTIAGMKQNIHNWHKGRKDIKKIYVGKTSATKKGINAAYNAMQTRVDGHKRKMKINEMKLLHIGGSKRSVDQAERELVAYNRKQGRKSGNQTGGGGGAPTEGQSHVLYAALKTTKPGKKKTAGKRRSPQ